MSLKSLVLRLTAPVSDTSDTRKQEPAISAQGAPSVVCTSDTPDSSEEGYGPAANDETAESDGYWSWLDDRSFVRVKVFDDRWTWFMKKGLCPEDAEQYAAKLEKRDCDRRLCLECCHLVGRRPWHCANWKIARVSIRASDAALGMRFVTLLQRCDGFSPANFERN